MTMCARIIGLWCLSVDHWFILLASFDTGFMQSLDYWRDLH